MVPPVLVGAKILLKKLVKKFLVVAVQSLLAALAEETSIRADKAGFRRKDGTFVSKKEAILRVIAFIALIGFIVQVVPPLIEVLFVNVAIQSLGLLIILGDAAIHKLVDQWSYRRDILADAIGSILLFGPYILSFL